jgi:ribose 5-phosphate isomerase B
LPVSVYTSDMKLFISSDHAGFELKQHLVNYLEENGLEVFDKGPYEFKADDDYPDWISLVAEEVSVTPDSLGIVIGLSGQGEAIAANKFKGVRAGVYYGGPIEIPQLLREHNNANVLSLSAKFLDKSQAERAVDVFIETQFSKEERHVRRIKKIAKIENPQ